MSVGGLWRRTPVLDEYVEDGACVVFVGGRLVVLSSLATSLLDRLGRGTATVDELAAALTAEFGEPPGDGEALVNDLLAELRRQGLAEPAP